MRCRFATEQIRRGPAHRSARLARRADGRGWIVKVAVTADLHWGIRADGDAATRRMVAELVADPPDLLLLAGDIGAGDDFAPCLRLFADLPSRKALVPGNHDIWVTED